MKKEIKSYVRENILKLKPYSSAREEYTAKAKIYLDANENPFENGFNRYPDPLQKDIKKALSKLKNITPDHIFVGNGSDEVLDILFRIFCEPKEDSTIFSSPTYGMYKVLAELHNVKGIDVPLTKELRLDTEKLLASKAKILFVCSPNNPTGAQFPREDVIRLVKEFDGIVVADEAYVDFASYSLLNEIDKHPNLVVCQTFSKSWGLAGLRVGLAYANPYIIELMTKVKMPYNVNVATQKEVLKVLENPKPIQDNIRDILKEKSSMLSLLEKMPFVKRVFKSDANFLMVEFNENVSKLHDFFTQKGVLVRNQSNKLHCENTLRFTIGTKEENQEVRSILNDYFSH